MKKITCFCLGALAGALAMAAYRELQAARELAALSDLLPDSPPRIDPAELDTAVQELKRLMKSANGVTYHVMKDDHMDSKRGRQDSIKDVGETTP